MQTVSYIKYFEQFFKSSETDRQLNEAARIIKKSKRIFFIGNGGSNSICSHMMEDFGKMARIPSLAFSDPALITCYANDYGYDRAMEEWLKLHFTDGDLLVAISSSGESANILNAVKFVNTVSSNTITLSGFKENNSLRKLGALNFHVPVTNYGIVECYHQVILHIALDIITGTHTA
jgi:D-sedoheptulose 7-phosphate isomerase